MNEMERKGCSMKRSYAVVSTLIAVMGMGFGLSAAARPPGETVTPNFSHVIPNVPGKSLIALVVTYPPGGASLPHHHAKSSFIYGYVLSGTIESQVEGEPTRILKAGDSFYEEPGAHHLAGRNHSKTQPASLLAVFIVDTDDTELTTPDK